MSAVAVLDSDQLLQHLQGHRRLTRRTIERFPAEAFETFSVGGMRPFGVITRELLAMAGPFVKAFATDDWGQWDEDRSPIARDAALAAWDENTAMIDEHWPGLVAKGFTRELTIFGQWPGTVQQHLFYVIDNEVHHRAQGFAYLRALGVEPPFFWER
ncbi:MAG: damage-inducible protein DinB [Gemmatimonadaceae bacterium]|nr:damage-inducible protein DinB [Gemmatimonadaceae bacterium]